MENPRYYHPEVTPVLWGSDKTIRFFLEAHRSQEQLGIIDSWRAKNISLMELFPEDFEDKQERQEFLAELDRPLPLAVVLLGQPESSHSLHYELALSKINPLSGAMYRTTSALVGSYDVQGGIIEAYDGFSGTQMAYIREQMGNQAMLGMHLND